MPNKERILMLGTGHATVTRCYNACFLLSVPGFNMLVDAGGGNGILRQLEKSGTSISDINAIFVTHAHTDHVLGVVWLLRMIGEGLLNGSHRGHCNIYSHRKVLDLLKIICTSTLSPKMWMMINEFVDFIEINETQIINLTENLSLQPFDVQTSEKQFGFKAMLPSGKKLVCFGDAPIKDSTAHHANNADWLICEAFCLEMHRNEFHPETIHHATVAETAKKAQKCAVKNLIIYHTEDKYLQDRKYLYTLEASRFYDGKICIPNDMEVINMHVYV